jgi:hypothetical protein
MINLIILGITKGKKCSNLTKIILNPLLLIQSHFLFPCRLISFFYSIPFLFIKKQNRMLRLLTIQYL